MRNYILFLLLILIVSLVVGQNNNTNDFAASTNGQNNRVERIKSNNFSLGLNLCPAISWLDVNHDDLQTDGATITGGIGFIAEYNGDKFFSLVSGLNFYMPGGYVFDGASMQNTSTVNNFLMNYYAIEAPLLLRINSSLINQTIYYMQGGVSAGYRIAANEFHRASSLQFENVTTSITNLSNPFLLNYIVGFGAKFNTHRKYQLFAEVNYKSSLMNMASETGYTDSGRYNSTPVPIILAGNMVFAVGVLF
ncbi:MAG: outer membrane beta-barrel protein [Paludibacter sp.]|nr:outer membrane beta-barrel protein [Paludibacter sp.]